MEGLFGGRGAVGDADDGEEFFSEAAEVGVCADLFESPGEAEAPVCGIRGAGAVDAVVESEQFGDHEGGEAGSGCEERLDQAEADAFGEGRPGTLGGDGNGGELAEDAEGVVGA